MSDSDQDKAEKPVKLVHYTTAEAAYSILSEGNLWMRKANFMNDSSEIFFGYSVFKKTLEKEIDAIQQESLKDEIFKEELKKRVGETLKKLLKILRLQAYITSFSKISEEEQKTHLGRLSMWRAYGGKAGVAIVFKELFYENLQKLQTNTKNTKIIINDINYCLLEDPKIPDILKDFSYGIDDATIPFIKHKGFKEETECRLVMLNPKNDKYPNLKSEFKTIRNIPQRIYTYEFDPENCVDYIIVGPTLDIDHARAIRESFQKVTYKNKCVFLSKKIYLSNIPLRVYG